MTDKNRNAMSEGVGELVEDDLVKQLRFSAEAEAAEFGYPPYQSNYWRAADTITTLQARLAEVTGALEWAHREIERHSEFFSEDIYDPLIDKLSMTITAANERGKRNA
jgi:predicted lipoprotein